MIIRSPEPILNRPYDNSVFLAGSIEMGKAEHWQARATQLLYNRGWTVFDPRREDWDSSWVQSKDNPDFRYQVEWELRALDAANVILFYFQPGTMSPISLLELGLHAKRDSLVMVVCPDGFWRKGNVDIVCEKYDIPMFGTVDEAIETLGVAP